MISETYSRFVATSQGIRTCEWMSTCHVIRVTCLVLHNSSQRPIYARLRCNSAPSGPHTLSKHESPAEVLARVFAVDILPRFLQLPQRRQACRRRQHSRCIFQGGAGNIELILSDVFGGPSLTLFTKSNALDNGQVLNWI